MKGYLAVLAATASASKLETFIADGVMAYAGLEKSGTKRAKLPSGEDGFVKAFGYDSAYTSSDQNFGYNLGLNMDLGFAYTFPVYNQDNYLVMRQMLRIYLGGRNYFTVLAGYVKITFFLDVWGVNATFLDNYMRYDIVNYGNFC